MRTNYSHTSGYSTLLALLLIGFMLVLTIGVYQLVLREFQDTKSMEYALKAFAGAEGSVELALLQAKNNGYTLEAEMKTPNLLSKSLFPDPFKRIHSKDVEIQYRVEGTTQKVDGTLPAYDFHIIPLFYYDLSKTLHTVNMLKLEAPDTILWNIIDNEAGLSGNGAINLIGTMGKKKTFDGVNTIFDETMVENFLRIHEKPYMMIQNPTEHPISYTLSTTGSGRFSQEWMVIEGSGEVGGFQQTLQVRIRTSAYLNVLKYVIFGE